MTQSKDKACFICSRDTLDGAYPALILAINAARLGMEAKVFYTFMGVNLVRKGGIEKAKFIPPRGHGRGARDVNPGHRDDEKEGRKGQHPGSS
ncbi:MAG: DsrE/DsrF/DrsH-like family protein [Desulfobaccales bacterium]